MGTKEKIQGPALPGYEGPFATICSQAIDEELQKSEEMYSGKLIEYMQKLVDRIFVFEVEELLDEAASCFCSARIKTKHGEFIVVVPWPLQYRNGACIAIYHKGQIEDLEIDVILAQLIEIIQFGECKNEQRYLM